jgi:hypothetical protein
MTNWIKATDTCINGHTHSLFTCLKNDILKRYECSVCGFEVFKDRSEEEKRIEIEEQKRLEEK